MEFWYLEIIDYSVFIAETRCVSWMVFLIPNRQMKNTYFKVDVRFDSEVYKC